MSDANLLAFGCAVSFVVLAGVYVYLREGYEAAKQTLEAEAGEPEVIERKLRDVA